MPTETRLDGDTCTCPPDPTTGEVILSLDCEAHGAAAAQDAEARKRAAVLAVVNEPGVPTIHAALANVMRDVNAVAKTRQNTDQHYNFRGIEDVMNALHGPLSKHGVLMLPETLERVPEQRTTRNNQTMQVMNLHVRFTFVGPAGDSLCCDTWGEGQDMADKATNKAMSAALKYALFQVFMVPTAEMQDSDRGAEPASASTAEPEQPQARATARARSKAVIDADLKAMAASVNKAPEELVVKWEAANPKGWGAATANEQEAWLDYLRPYISQQAAAIESQVPPSETPLVDALRSQVTPPEAEVAREEDLPDGPAFPETQPGELPTDAHDPFAQTGP